MSAKVRRIGVLTGGGDCPGLNAVLRGLVLRSSELEVEVIGIEDGFEGLLDNTEGQTRVLGRRDVAALLDRGGTILGTSNRGNPFAYPQPDGTMADRSAADTRNHLAPHCVSYTGTDSTSEAAAAKRRPR